jgi:hypothetical protein
MEEERHPVQALVWGIVMLVVSLLGPLFLIAPTVLSVVFISFRNPGVQITSGVIGLVFGLLSLFGAIAVLIIRGATNHLYASPYEDGRFRSGTTTRSIAFPIAIITLVWALLIIAIAALILSGVFH